MSLAALIQHHGCFARAAGTLLQGEAVLLPALAAARPIARRRRLRAPHDQRRLGRGG